MYVQKEHVIKFFPNLLFKFGDDVIHQETIKCNITMNFKNKKQQYSIFSLKNRTVMSEHTKYRDNYGKKMFVYLHAFYAGLYKNRVQNSTNHYYNILLF